MKNTTTTITTTTTTTNKLTHYLVNQGHRWEIPQKKSSYKTKKQQKIEKVSYSMALEKIENYHLGKLSSQ